jgi:fibronectin type 3 domain-containing protein
MKYLLTLIFSLMFFMGAAMAQTPHSATLNWTQSTTPGVTGNNVYRGTVSGGPYTLLTTTPVAPATTYMDTAVSAATTYYYVVTALVGTEESAYSNQVTAVIPSNTNSPTNLTVTAK